jgi:hypothetical protein
MLVIHQLTSGNSPEPKAMKAPATWPREAVGEDLVRARPSGLGNSVGRACV